MQGRDRLFAAPRGEVVQALGDAVFHNLEVIPREVGDQLPRPVGNRHPEGDEVDAGPEDHLCRVEARHGGDRTYAGSNPPHEGIL